MGILKFITRTVLQWRLAGRFFLKSPGVEAVEFIPESMMIFLLKVFGLEWFYDCTSRYYADDHCRHRMGRRRSCCRCVPVQIRRFRGGYIFFKENPAWGRLFGVLMLLLSLVLFAFARDNSVKGNRSVWLIASALGFFFAGTSQTLVNLPSYYHQ